MENKLRRKRCEIIMVTSNTEWLREIKDLEEAERKCVIEDSVKLI